jgi:hypothetical protein
MPRPVSEALIVGRVIVGLPNWIQLVASLATAIGVSVGALQLWYARRRATTTFEDALASEYRQLTARLPTAALLGETLPVELQRPHFHEFYRYSDLTNNQAFLRQIGRVSKKTWSFWVDGMRTNLARPDFATTWADISARAEADFSELRRVVAEQFKAIPTLGRCADLVQAPLTA